MLNNNTFITNGLSTGRISLTRTRHIPFNAKLIPLSLSIKPALQNAQASKQKWFMYCKLINRYLHKYTCIFRYWLNIHRISLAILQKNIDSTLVYTNWHNAIGKQKLQKIVRIKIFPKKMRFPSIANHYFGKNRNFRSLDKHASGIIYFSIIFRQNNFNLYYRISFLW